MGTQTQRSRDERGFTLIEILVVIIVIGILTAIVLPIFLQQTQKGDDASAKSNVRSLVSAVEACYTGTTTYADCDSAGELEIAGLPYGPGPGKVSVVSASTNNFQVRAISEHSSNFIWSRTGGTITRTCTPVSQGDCSATGDW